MSLQRGHSSSGKPELWLTEVGGVVSRGERGTFRLIGAILGFPGRSGLSQQFGEGCGPCCMGTEDCCSGSFARSAVALIVEV